jgi:hypothetical protein
MKMEMTTERMEERIGELERKLEMKKKLVKLEMRLKQERARAAVGKRRERNAQLVAFGLFLEALAKCGEDELSFYRDAAKTVKIGNEKMQKHLLDGLERLRELSTSSEMRAHLPVSEETDVRAPRRQERERPPENIGEQPETNIEERFRRIAENVRRNREAAGSRSEDGVSPVLAGI